jgi:hypothetical protein
MAETDHSKLLGRAHGIEETAYAPHRWPLLRCQSVVVCGSGDLWAIPGVSAGFIRDAYPMRAAGILIALAAALGAGLALGLRRLRKT